MNENTQSVVVQLDEEKLKALAQTRCVPYNDEHIQAMLVGITSEVMQKVDKEFGNLKEDEERQFVADPDNPGSVIGKIVKKS